MYLHIHPPAVDFDLVSQVKFDISAENRHNEYEKIEVEIAGNVVWTHSGNLPHQTVSIDTSAITGKQKMKFRVRRDVGGSFSGPTANFLVRWSNIRCY